MKKMRILALALAVCLIAALFAGCGGAAASESAESTPEAISAEPEAAAAEPEAQPADAAETDASAAEAEEPEEEPEPEPKVYASDVPLTYSLWMGLFQFAAQYVSDPAEDLTLLREISNRLNVSFDINANTAEALSTNFNLMMASGDYCDIISEMGYYTPGIEDAIDSGIIRDVRDLVEEHAPNYWEVLTAHPESYMKMTTESGRMGSLCVFIEEDDAAAEQYGFITNGAWYDEFGMDIADTVDEFEDYLTQAHDKHGAQFSVYSSGMENGILSAYNIEPEMYVVDGEVRFGYLQDEMKDYFQLMNRWYHAGLIEDGFYNGTNTGDQLAGTAAETVSAWSGTAEVSKNVYLFDDAGHTSKVAGTPYLKMNESDQIHTLTAVSYISDIATYAWSFRADLPDEDVIHLLNVVDYLFTDEGNLLFNWGVEGEAFEFDENGEPQWTDLVANNPEGMMYVASSYIYASQNGTTYIPGVLDRTKGYYSFTDDQWQALEAFTTAGDTEYSIPRSVSLTSDESTAYYEVYTDISTYISENRVEFIIGDELTDAAWKTFTDTLYSMGVEEMISIYQDAYDRYDGLYAAAAAEIGG